MSDSNLDLIDDEPINDMDIPGNREGVYDSLPSIDYAKVHSIQPVSTEQIDIINSQGQIEEVQSPTGF